MEYPQDELAARRNPRKKKPAPKARKQFGLPLRCSAPGCILPTHGPSQIHITAAAADRAFAEHEGASQYPAHWRFEHGPERDRWWGEEPPNDLLDHLKSTLPASARARKPPKRNPMAKRRRNPSMTAWQMELARVQAAERHRQKMHKWGAAVARGAAQSRGVGAGYKRGSEMTAAEMREGVAAYNLERQLAAVARKPKRKRKPAGQTFHATTDTLFLQQEKERKARARKRKAKRSAAPSGHGGGGKKKHARGRAAPRSSGLLSPQERIRRAWMAAKGFKPTTIKKLTGGAAPKKGRKKGGKKAAATRKRKLRAMTAKFLRYSQNRKGVKRHLRARVAIRAKRKVAGLLVLNPRTGAIMSRVLVANPRRRKKHHRRATNPRRRNPVGTAVRTVKAQIAPMAAGGAAGMLAGYVDTKWLSDKPLVSILSKIGLGLAGAFVIAKKSPSAASGWAGGMLSAAGYTQGVKFGGGHVALSGLGALQGVADMAADDPQMANLIAGLSDGESLGDDAYDSAAALGDPDEEMAGLVTVDE